MTAPTTEASALCALADRLDWPEQHARCAGNAVLRMPGDTDAHAPVQTYRCGCACHASQGRRTVYVGRRDRPPIPPGRTA